MEIKDFRKEYRQKGAYHHHLFGFKKMWMERNYKLICRGIGGKILDIACGDGRAADFIRSRQFVIDGFDISPEAIRLARTKRVYRHLSVNNILEQAPYRRADYDFFICSLSLQYLKEELLLRHFEMMSEILKRGGEYRFSFPNTKPQYSPEKIEKGLSAYFSYIEMQTISGMIPEADDLPPERLKKIFKVVAKCRLDRSYHYLVILRNSMR